MKKGIAITLLAVAVIVGGLSMGCIDKTIEDAFIPEVVEVVEVVEVSEEVVNTTIVIEVVTEEVVGLYYPILSYSRCFPSIPENVVGFDTPMERAYILQGELNEKMDLLYSGMVQQRYQYRGEQAYTEFYQGYYQDKLNKYTKMYCSVGNKLIGDFELYLADNSTGNSSVGNFSA